MRPFKLALGIAIVSSAFSSSVSAAPPDPRLDWAGTGSFIWWHAPTCGVESIREQSLGRNLTRIHVDRPLVGALVTNYLGMTVGNVTEVSVRRRGERAWLRVTMVGSDTVCGIQPLSDEDGQAGGTAWAIRSWRRLPPGEMRFHAWTPDGRPTVPIKARKRGECTQSWVNPRFGVWRCFAGRYVMDTCFSSPVELKRLLCVSSPWARSAMLVQGSGFEALSSRGPWAIGTSNGRRCSFLSGAGAPMRAGRRMNYGCWQSETFGAAGYLWGRPAQRAGSLAVLYSSSPESELRWVRVRTRWN